MGKLFTIVPNINDPMIPCICVMTKAKLGSKIVLHT